MGREIAHVMSYTGAGWLDRPEREKEENASKLLAAAEDQARQRRRRHRRRQRLLLAAPAQIVGDKGKVLAPDIQPEMLKIIRKKMKPQNVTNIEPIQCTEKDPKLPAGGVDLILMVDVYHEFSYPYEVTTELVKALKPGGRLVFVEFRLEDEKVPIRLLHRMSIKQVMREMEPQQLKHVETLTHLPWQHVIIFEKKAEEKKQP